MNDNTSIDEDFNLIMNEYRERQKLIKEKLILLYSRTVKEKPEDTKMQGSSFRNC